MKKATKFTGLVFLAIHLLFTHARLLFNINPEKSLDSFKAIGFTFSEINELFIISLIFALAYSVITVTIIILYADNRYRYLLISIVALLDGLGVFIYYNSNIVKLFILFSSFYYAVYTCFIIVALGFHQFRIRNERILRNESILKLSREGMKQRDIADEMNISASTVNRTLKKLNKSK